MISRRVLLLGGLAIVAVVCNHAAQWGTISMFWWTDRYLAVPLSIEHQMNTPSYIALAAIRKLAVFSVPAFVFISGFFVAYAARGSQSTLSWKTTWARISNLLPPYLIWSGVVFVGDFLQGDVYTPLEYLRRLVLGKAVGAYFFVPLLCLLYLISPLVIRLAKARWRALLIVSALLHLSVVAMAYFTVLTDLFGVKIPAIELIESIPGALLLGAVLFFALGAVCGLRLQQLKAWLARSKSILLVSLIATASLAILEAEVLFRLTGSTETALHDSVFTIPSSIYAIAVIFCFLAFDKIPLPFPRALRQLGVRSYGIYLLHPPLLEFTAKATQKFVPWILAYQALFQPVLITAGILGPTALMAAVAASPLRKYYRYLFG